MRILFTGVGRRVELLQAFREAARVLQKDLKIYGADMSESAPALAYCDFARKTAPMQDPRYIEDLLSICSDDRIDLIIPTIDIDLLKLSQNRYCFEKIGTKVLVSSPNVIDICNDKNNTSVFFNKCGLHTPTPTANWENYQGLYPAFIKPKNGSASINAYRVNNVHELEQYASSIDDYIVQPFIEGKEYTIDVVCDWNGTPISIVPRERVQVRAGEVLVTRICMDSKMIEGAKKVCEELKPSGPITIQLIRDKNNTDWFIEINPRFGGGAPLSMKAGSRSAETVLRMDDSDIQECTNDIADGALYSRFDQSVLVGNTASKIRGVIFDLDDTLFSEKEYIKSGYKAVSEYLNGDFEDTLWNAFENGEPAIDVLLKEIGRLGDKENVLEVYRNHIPDIHLYEGVVDLIHSLKQKKFKVGIITDGRPEGQKNKIHALGLDDLVDDVIITDELGGKQFRKPCDIAFRIMQLKWMINASEIVYVGDNISKDFRALIQLGMRGIFFRNIDGLYYKEAQWNYPNVVAVNSIEEINRVILNQGA